MNTLKKIHARNPEIGFVDLLRESTTAGDDAQVDLNLILTLAFICGVEAQ